MTEQKHIIWSSDPDYEDWRGDLEEQYRQANRNTDRKERKPWN